MPLSIGFSGSSAGKESACSNAGDTGLNSWVGQVPLEKGNHSSVLGLL